MDDIGELLLAAYRGSRVLRWGDSTDPIRAIGAPSRNKNLDKAASDYEESWRRQLEPAQNRLLAMAALRPGERALDIACGTGLLSFPAAAAVGPGGTVIGTDISTGMVERARHEAMARLALNVTFRRMEAEIK